MSDFWDQYELDQYEEWRPRLLGHYVRLINQRNRYIKLANMRAKNPQYCNKSKRNFENYCYNTGKSDEVDECPTEEQINEARINAC